MAAWHSFRIVRVGLVLSLGSLLASSCVVDKSGLVFDDDQYADAVDGNGSGGDGGDGGDTSSSGGQLSSSGGLGGTTSSTGGMGGGPTLLCEPNSTQCNGNQVELCSGNEWIAIGGPCPNACVDGLCTGMCSPGSNECLSSIQTQHCNDVGEWEDEFCEFACVGGTCGGVCRPGDRGCSEDTRTLCGDTGEWEDQDTCAGDCDAGVCVGACPVGETQCGGDAENPVQITCNGTNWETSPETPCDFICDELTGECGGECVPFSSDCATGTEVQVCDSTATYGAPEECPYVCDDDTGACGGECVPGSQQCTGATIQECDSTGHWVDSTTCDSSTPICLEETPGQPECVECAPGAKLCSPVENALMVCSSGGQWPRDGTACPVAKGEQTLCWKNDDGNPACVLPSQIDCPIICGKFGCPKGCFDSNTRWGCSSGTVKPTDCGLLTSCNAGVCE